MSRVWWWGYRENGSGSKEDRVGELGSREYSRGEEWWGRAVDFFFCSACIRVRFGIGHRMSCGKGPEDYGESDMIDDACDDVPIDLRRGEELDGKWPDR